MIKNVKKSIISILLALIMIFGAGHSMINAIAESEANKDTPVAQIENDDYIPYNYANSNKENDVINSITKEVESVGGYVETYSSEEEYEKAQTAKVQSASVETYAKAETVKQVITVMTTATGSKKNGNYVESKPIANAIVRINGTPRFTDRKGQVKATLVKEDYVELIIEKEDYNPYIEIMDVTGEEKIVYLKQPSDDIDVYAAMLYYNGDEFNILAQECHINDDLIPDYYAELTIMTDIIADEYFLLVNGVEYDCNNEPTFYDIRFDFLNPGDKFSICAEYDGIKSKIIDTYLSIEDVHGIIDDESEGEFDSKFNPKIEEGFGIFDNFNIDLIKLINIKDILTKLDPAGLTPSNSVNFNVNYNARKGTLSFECGYSYSKFVALNKPAKEAQQKIKEGRKNQENINQQIKEEQQNLNGINEEIRQLEAKNKESTDEWRKLDRKRQQSINKMHQLRGGQKQNAPKMKQYQEQLFNEIKTMKGEVAKNNEIIGGLTEKTNNGQMRFDDLMSKLNKLKNIEMLEKEIFAKDAKGITLGFQIVGFVEIKLKNFSLEKVALCIGGTFGFRWMHTLVIGGFPLFIDVNGSINLRFDLNVVNEGKLLTFENFMENILTTVGLKVRGEIGAGLNDIISCSLFLDLGGNISVYPFAKDKEGNIYLAHWDNYGWEASIGFGIRFEVLFFDKEVGFEYAWREFPKLPNSQNEANNYLVKTMARSLSYNSYSLSDRAKVSENIYQGSKPQIVCAGGKQILTWIEDCPERDDYNRTVLKYSVLEDGNWSEEKAVYGDGFAEFYHNMYYDGEELYIAWQKTVRKLSETDDLISCGTASEIWTAKFDFEANEFIDAKRLTSNSDLDYAPKFALKSSLDDPLTLVWQKNSENNIMGTDGDNSIWCSSCLNGQWTEPACIYTCPNYISCVTSAYINGELNLSFLEYEDLTNLESGNVRVISDSKNYILDVGGVENTRFCSISDEIVLCYNKGNEMIISRDLNNLETLNGLDVQKIGGDYQIIKNKNVYIIAYKTGDADKSKICCARYDFSDNSWCYDITLACESDVITYWQVAIDTEGYVITTYNITDENNNVAMCYISKRFNVDYIIDNIIFNVIENGLFEFDILISNIGDFNLNNVSVAAFGIEQEIEFDEPLIVGMTSLITVNCTVPKNTMQGKFTLNAGGVIREYYVNLVHADIKMEGEITLQNCDQIFKINAINQTDYVIEATLNIYINTELKETFEISFNGYDVYSKDFVYEDLNFGDTVYFEIVSGVQENYYGDNAVMLFSKIGVKSKDIFNRYMQVMQSARNFIV